MDIIEEIKKIVGPEHVFDDRVECISYSRDLSVHEGIPDVVVFAQTTEQISGIMKLANDAKVPVTVQGSGTATTGASLPVEFIKRFETLFNTKIHEGYGLTECPVCVENPYGRPTKPGSIGQPIPEFAAKVVDEGGKEIPVGQPGELIVKGPGVMKGYLNREKETAETIKDGWLHTGDLAYRDEDGFFYHTARRKEIIKVGGRRISPKEIEEVIVTFPGVVDCSISAIFDEILGEALKAEVVVADLNDPSVDEMEFKRLCGEKLALEKIPQVFDFTSRMRVAATGKKTKKLNSV